MTTFSESLLTLSAEEQTRFFQELLLALKASLPWRQDQPGLVSLLAPLETYCTLLGISLTASETVPPSEWQCTFPSASILSSRLQTIALDAWSHIEADALRYLSYQQRAVLVPALVPSFFLPPLLEPAALFPSGNITNEDTLAHVELVVLPNGKTSAWLTSKQAIFLALQELPVGTIFRVIVFFLDQRIEEKEYQIVAVPLTHYSALRQATYPFFCTPGVRPLPLPSVLVQPGVLALPGAKILQERGHQSHRFDPLGFLEPIERSDP